MDYYGGDFDVHLSFPMNFFALDLVLILLTKAKIIISCMHSQLVLQITCTLQHFSFNSNVNLRVFLGYS